MAVVQTLKKNSKTKTIADLTLQFVKKITRIIKDYKEARIIFDRYVEQSLKEKTRAKRATSLDSSLKIYDVHSEMKLANISIKDLLSSSKTKAQLAKHFGLALLNKFAGSDQKIVVVEGTQATPNILYVIPVRISTHEHEEADTLIPLHVKDIMDSHQRFHVDVWSPDTDVLLLVMDLVAVDEIKLPNRVNLITGIGHHQYTRLCKCNWSQEIKRSPWSP